MIKNIFDRLKQNILFYTFLFFGIFILGNIILNIFNMNYREWVYILSLILISIGLILGIIQVLCKIKNKTMKIIGIIIFVLALIPCAFYTFIFCIFSYQPEHVVIKDGKKMVAYVNGFMDTYVEYYDYKNFLVVGNKLKIKEYYGDGGFNPIENKYGYDYPVIRTEYYDENGTIIHTENNTVNNVEQNTNITSNQPNDVTQEILDDECYVSGEIYNIDENNMYFTDENSKQYYISKNAFVYINGRTSKEINLADIKIGDYLNPENKKILIYRNIYGEELNQELLLNLTLTNDERIIYINTIELEEINIEDNNAFVKIKYGDIIGDKLTNETFETLVQFNSNTKFYSKGNNINSIYDLEYAKNNINSVILDKNTINKKNPAIVIEFESSDN